MRNKKRGQVWVETVVYTLIGLALIGLVLVLITPKINEIRDRAVVEQTMDSLNIFDERVKEVLTAPGNVRIVEMRIKKGQLTFYPVYHSDLADPDPPQNTIGFVLDESRAIFSEPDTWIKVGKIDVLTVEGVKRHKIDLRLDYHDLYENVVLKVDGDFDRKKVYTGVSLPYKFSIENLGFEDMDIVDANGEPGQDGTVEKVIVIEVRDV
jgi:type II secretory pathway pseudopilin PulG